MTPDEKIETVKMNLANLSKEEQNFLAKTLVYPDTRMKYMLSKITDDLEEPQLDYWADHIWDTSFGKGFAEGIERAKKLLEDVDSLKHAFNNIVSINRWRSYSTSLLKDHLSNGSITPFMLYYGQKRFDKDSKNLFDSYMADPHFAIGDMVQFRSNIGVDALLVEHKYSSGSYWYGAKAKDLQDAQKKTFMIIEMNPKVEGTKYARNYSYNPKQGGSRLYRVLPIGETTTYIVVEKFLKTARIKGVKNAKKK